MQQNQGIMDSTRNNNTPEFIFLCFIIYNFILLKAAIARCETHSTLSPPKNTKDNKRNTKQK